MNTTIQYYIQQIEAVNYKSLWIGANITEKISGISEKTAFIRPIVEVHSVAELIAHISVLYMEVANKIRIKYNLQQSDCPKDWRSNKELKAMGWEELKREYEQSILSLVIILGGRDDSFLEDTYIEEHKSSHPFEFLLEGVIHHTLYHLGQIGITIKLLLKKELHV